MVIVGLTVAVIAAVMLIMAIGAMFGRGCLRGSCGGPEVLGSGGESLRCAACPNRPDEEERRAPLTPG